MNLDQLSRAGGPVEGVHILGDQEVASLAADLPVFQSHQGVMGWIRLGAEDLFEAAHVPAPASYRVLLKVAERTELRDVALPDRVGVVAAKSRDAAGQADAGTRDHDHVAFADAVDGACQDLDVVAHRSAFRPRR